MSHELSVTDISRQYLFLNILVKPSQIKWKTSEKYYKDINLSFNQYILKKKDFVQLFYVRYINILCLEHMLYFLGACQGMVTRVQLFIENV